VIKGIYNNLEEAHKRQNIICNGPVQPVFKDSLCVGGKNGFISWIKKIEMGDCNDFDIKNIS
jgi:hypothetical protein